jgi:hypothetical protein
MQLQQSASGIHHVTAHCVTRRQSGNPDVVNLRPGESTSWGS